MTEPREPMKPGQDIAAQLEEIHRLLATLVRRVSQLLIIVTASLIVAGCMCALGYGRYHAARPGKLLCLGDSIRIGWAKYLECESPVLNGGSTVNGLYGIEHLNWTEGRHWEVIVFNFGLHDIQTGVSHQEYAVNLRRIVRALKPLCGRLYFCTTTPGRDRHPRATAEIVWPPAAVWLYNDIALDVMASEDVPVIHLYALASSHHEWWKSDCDIHYTEAGYKAFASCIKQAIGRGEVTRSPK